MPVEFSYYQSEEAEHGKFEYTRQLPVSPNGKHILAGILITLACTLATVEARPKTDVIILKNGDRITGEIKKMERGRLSLSTDSMRTVSIEWEDVERITSQYYFEIETTVGNKILRQRGHSGR